MKRKKKRRKDVNRKKRSDKIGLDRRSSGTFVVGRVVRSILSYFNQRQCTFVEIVNFRRELSLRRSFFTFYSSFLDRSKKICTIDFDVTRFYGKHACNGKVTSFRYRISFVQTNTFFNKRRKRNFFFRQRKFSFLFSFRIFRPKFTIASRSTRSCHGSSIKFGQRTRTKFNDEQ